ncbi:hypothetical protein SAMN06265365_14917 [Tistlia consotensis]|uniref:Uncharacterized protein n=1 Tax=Tistlia consotensis USBA 355 TaxID=560819 RepID=A0A1Y6CRI4_9PROT|nr:hypothetical protein [Tistlia consotensis]SMF83334.1 hypothetical protein SAMN05428998_14918 [Tistlia consotensis USBA 355]SNS32568.1 hypothetical protein SAMN06265365_14917 [Tistlia consotensis]
MAVRFALLALLAVVAAALAALPVRAQSTGTTPPPWYAQPPACTAEREGQLFCQVQVLCECRHFRASLMDGTKAGYRWDCGPLRPRCGEAVQPKDPTTNPYQGPYPGILQYSPNILNNSN